MSRDDEQIKLRSNPTVLGVAAIPAVSILEETPNEWGNELIHVLLDSLVLLPRGRVARKGDFEKSE